MGQYTNLSDISNLRALNDQQAAILRPVMAFELIFMIIGVMGNCLVCFVGGFRMKQTVTNRFVVTLAMVDLSSCLVCIPPEVAETVFPFLYAVPVLCKFQRYLRSSLTISSGLVLEAIAFYRHRRICRIRAQPWSLKQANLISLVVVATGFVLSVPIFFIFGNKRIPKINGTECSISDQVQSTVFPMLYYSFLFVLFISTFSTLGILYSLIAKRIWRGRKLYTDSRARSASLPDCRVFSTLAGTDGNMAASKFFEDLTRSLQRKKQPLSPLTPTASLRRRKKNPYSRTKTTFIMFLMAATFLLSCLPYVIVSILRLAIKDFEPSMLPAGQVVFHLCLKSFIISSAVNPYIYGFCNDQFRKECARLLQSWGCLKAEDETHSNSTPASM